MSERGSAGATPRGGLRDAGSLLARNPDFRRLYVGGLVSLGGDWFLTVALFALVLDLQGSALSLALVVIGQELPFVLMSPVGGALVDRLDRRRLMIAADLARAALCAGFLLVREPGDLWLAFVLLFALSSWSAVFDPASSAAVPNLVEPRDLATANALLGSAWGTMLAVGAAIGGVVAATLGRDTAFLVDAASFLASAALLARIRRPFGEPREGVEHPGVVAATAETLAYARRDHRVLALLAVKGGFGLAAGVFVLIGVFGKEVFGRGEVGIGTLMAFRGLGALVGPFLGRALAGRDGRRLHAAILSALATFGVGYVLFGLAPSLALAAAAVFLAHLGGGAQWTLSTYGLQRLVPDRIRGRVFAFDLALVTLSLAASSLVAGWAADHLGPRRAAVALGAVALAWALAWWGATRGVRRAASFVPLEEPGLGTAGR